MLALRLALTAAVVVFAPQSAAQVEDKQYTVWSSVVLQRSGERTPEILGDLSPTLTSLGANQAYAAGSFFRNRYILATASSNNDSGDGAPLFDLSKDVVSSLDLYAVALDQQWNIATAYAFLQGLYPPFAPANPSTGNFTLNPTSFLANNTYLDGPLGGYQYPQVHVTGADDYSFIYLSGNLECPAFVDAAAEWTSTPEFVATQEQFSDLYGTIGTAFLEDVLDEDDWDYSNAFAIYDYVNYYYVHNSSAATILDGSYDATSNTSYITMLRWLADQQLYAQLGNVSAYNPITATSGLDNGGLGSISTIAGNTLSSRVIDLLGAAIDVGGIEYKLNLLFADYQPFTSFFSLVGLPELDSDFYGTPGWGSSAVFELFSWVPINETGDLTFPTDSDDLWVRFYFRNGTDSSDDFQSYPLFNRGPDETDMLWSDFSYSMTNMAFSQVGDWCKQCGAVLFFCAAFNSTSDSADSSSDGGANNNVTPVLAGVIGALVSLAVAALLFGAAMLFAGVRLHRNPPQRRSKSDFGGFKGGQKMQSDQDLTLPKGATVVQEEQLGGAHERVGSWELKQSQQIPSARHSLDDHHDGIAPDAKPVEPSERV